MKLLFTRRKKLDIICWGLGEPVSHVGILLANGKVLHSDIRGTRVEHIKDFLKNRELVYDLEFIGDESNTNNIVCRVRNTVYDFLSFSYFTWRAFLRKLFKIPFPKHNRFDVPGVFLCVELAVAFIGEDTSTMLTPFDLYCELCHKDDWR